MPLPNYAIKTSTEIDPQIRLLLVGPPKSGKTFAAATFPNPLYVDFDNGLTATELRALQLAQLPFYSEEWVRTQYKSLHPSPTSPFKPASAFVQFINSVDVQKMTIEDTLVIDSLSTLSDAVKAELAVNTPKGKDGNPDTFWFWREWSNWFCAFCTKLKSFKCHVVLLAHEQEIRDNETGRVTSYKFCLQGQEFSPRLPQFFTDIYRQTKESRQIPGQVDKLKMQVEESYLWQVKTTPQFLACSRMNTKQLYMPATFKSFTY